MENQNEIVKKVVINVSTPLLLVTTGLAIKCWSLKKQLKIEKEYNKSTECIHRTLGYIEGSMAATEIFMNKDNDKETKSTKKKEETK